MLDLLKEVAAEVITPRFRALGTGEVMEKRPGDLVTVADREAETLITRWLRDAYPKAEIVAEEAVSADPRLLERAGAEHWFTVDPVDGTKNFVHGSADHAVMVAEVRGGDVVRSWIWQPAHDLAFIAERGAGATRNGEPLTAAPSGMPAAGAPLHGRTSRRSRVGQTIGDLPPLELSWACCGVDYPQLVCGATDFIVYGGANPWDHAPGSLLVTETGGVVLRTDGRPYDPRSTRPGLVAARSADVAELVSGLLDQG